MHLRLLWYVVQDNTIDMKIEINEKEILCEHIQKSYWNILIINQKLKFHPLLHLCVVFRYEF